MTFNPGFKLFKVQLLLGILRQYDHTSKYGKKADCTIGHFRVILVIIEFYDISEPTKDHKILKIFQLNEIKFLCQLSVLRTSMPMARKLCMKLLASMCSEAFSNWQIRCTQLSKHATDWSKRHRTGQNGIAHGENTRAKDNS